ncbi:hypothetical protein [Dechloromonas denitrificans]|uniref:hypothetical protein n=1 Tax=Dechloromonas denitrificans TaxID=281362 RepID=UPI001CF8DFEA|nr:hypothetical protein [Dechloromonas denitrificans]UCV01872.1 hypothetical protein KI611_12175 [Dechloromonas denitrificans]
MATLTITPAQSSALAITGPGADIVPFYSWDLKALFSAAAVADVIESPVFDLNVVSPKCDRLVAQKLVNTPAADTLKILVSPNGTLWYSAPLFNGGSVGGIASTNTSAAEVALTGLPSMRYVKAQLTLASAMSAQTAASLALSFMRE